jgi:hypothetical protein
MTVLGCVLAAVLTVAAAAQEPKSSSPDTSAVSVLKPVPDSGKFKITPLLAPAYNPEMQYLIAGGVLMSWKVGANPLRVQRSTLSSTLSLSSTGAVNVSMSLSSFWNEDRLRINADFSLKDMPDNYWGVGYHAGLSPTKGDSTTSYHRQWIKFNPRIVVAVAKNLLVGGTLELNHTIATEVNVEMNADPAYQQYGNDISNAGLGFVVQYDSRDVAANAWHGIYAAITGTNYGGLLGGDTKYSTILLDYRQYQPLGRPGRTLTWQLKSRIGIHGVPWPELSMLGTGYDLRGYVEGRFRDRSTLLGLVEYREMFTRSKGRLSRHGFVVWAGGGTLGSEPSHFHGFLPNGGVGYRLEIQPRANGRVDVGVGERSYGIYFNFNEAF